MNFFSNLIQGRFDSRPNRFVVNVKQGKRVFPAFLPNPGRLFELLLPGVNLYLEPSSHPNRKYSHTVIGVEKDGDLVLLDTHKNNDVAQYLLESNMVPGLKGWKIAYREYSLGKGKSRIDFLLEKNKKQMALEVKSCTLFGEKMAMFPDAPSIRATKHIRELAYETNRRGAILFLIHSSKPSWFLPDYHTDLEFAQTLLQLRKKLKIIPLKISWEKGFQLHPKVNKVKIPWEILEKECKDQGAYILVMESQKTFTLTGPAKGPYVIPKGFLLYVGSGKQNLSKRVARHRRKRKKHHWHVDYLLEQVDLNHVFLFRTQDDLECLLASKLQEKGRMIPHFGSSDCLCSSHLFHFPENPLFQKWFQRFVEYYQMDRLMEPL